MSTLDDFGVVPSHVFHEGSIHESGILDSDRDRFLFFGTLLCVVYYESMFIVVYYESMKRKLI